MNSSIAESLYGEELYQIPGKIVVVLAKDWVDVSDEERTLLSKMLVAVKQSLASVKIITLSSFSTEDVAYLSPAKVLVFGSSLKESLNLYEHRKINDLSIVVAESIDKLDDTKKKTLWLALKKMFEI